MKKKGGPAVGKPGIREYGCYLFDMDGTLMDTGELIYRSFLHTLEHYGRARPERDAVVSGIGIPLHRQLEQFMGPLSEDEFLSVYRVYNEFQKELASRYLSLFPGVMPLLKTLKAGGKKLAVVTSRKRMSLEYHLRLTELDGFFDVLITPESTLRHKPHPEPVLTAVSRLAAAPGDSLFVGDSIWDMESGRAAGVDTAYIHRDNADPASLAVKPTYIIRTMEELIAAWVDETKAD